MGVIDIADGEKLLVQNSEKQKHRPFHDVIVRPSLLALSFKMVPVVLMLITSYFIIGFVGDFFFSRYYQQVHHVQYIWYCLIRVFILVEIIRRYYDQMYIFTKHGIIHRTGRCSLRMGTIRIKYRDIREIRVEQSLAGRLLDFGSVLIGTASTDAYEGRFENVAHPKQLSAWLQSERIERQLGRLRQD